MCAVGTCATVAVEDHTQKKHYHGHGHSDVGSGLTGRCGDGLSGPRGENRPLSGPQHTTSGLFRLIWGCHSGRSRREQESRLATQEGVVAQHWGAVAPAAGYGGFYDGWMRRGEGSTPAA